MTDEEIGYMKNKINEVKIFLVETKDKEVYSEDLKPYMVFNEKDLVIIEKLLDLYLQQQYFVSKEESEQKEKKAYIDGTNIAHNLCNKKWKYKIKAKIEEVKDGTFDAKIVLQSLLEKE